MTIVYNVGHSVKPNIINFSVQVTFNDGTFMQRLQNNPLTHSSLLGVSSEKDEWFNWIEKVISH
jgi:hypothetical protein